MPVKITVVKDEQEIMSIFLAEDTNKKGGMSPRMKECLEHTLDHLHRHKESVAIVAYSDN